MAKKRVTDLSSLSSISDDDVFHVVDKSDTSSNAAGTSKKFTASNLKDFADRSFSQAVDVTEPYTITHNFGRRPSVEIVRNDGRTVEIAVTHTNTNELIVEFNSAFSGVINLS